MNPTFPPDFGKRLRAVMALHDIKHWQLAGRMDVSRGLVSQLCAGYKTPSGPIKLSLLDVFGLPTYEWINDAPKARLPGCPAGCLICQGMRGAA